MKKQIVLHPLRHHDINNEDDVESEFSLGTGTGTKVI